MGDQITIGSKKYDVSGEATDYYYKRWQEKGAYGEVRDLVPFEIALRRNFICVDVGANIGWTGILMAQHCPDGQVICFEPSPTNFRHLSRNITANNLRNVLVENVAVGDKIGTMLFEEHGPNSHATTPGMTSGIEVPVLTINERFINGPKIDFLKIDVEGFEWNVLNGASDIIRRDHPVMFIEFNSLTTVVEGRLLPQDLLAQIMDLYPYVAVIDRVTGKPKLIQRDAYSLKMFVAENLISGFLDDLLCWFEPDRF